MGALFFLFLMGLYIAFIVFLVKKFSRFKVAIIIFFIIVSFGNEVYGRYKLKKMCESEAGVHIYETVKDVEGFEADYYFYEDWLKNFGYKYIEKDKKIMVMPNNGEVQIKDTLSTTSS